MERNRARANKEKREMEREELKSLRLQLSDNFLYSHEVDEWFIDTCIADFTPAGYRRRNRSRPPRTTEKAIW
jgi:hypothetical protein